ncbi:MAG: squalene/phytoene synthase family protein [Alphaproteobacteria bacterium]|nr:squalene/phytoene synthase family protein [Alphaproteobacteria bacterium]
MSSSYRAPDASHRYVLEEARRADRDGFLCTLFAPEPARRGLLALLAFEHELARTPSVTSEPLLAEIRLQWWREAAAEAAGEGKPRAQPIVEALSETARRHDLSANALIELIDAHGEEIEGALDVVRTGRALADLQLRVLGVEDRASRRAAAAVAAAAFMGEGPERAALLAKARAEATTVDPAALPLLIQARLLDHPAGRPVGAWRKPLLLWWAARSGRW